MNIWLCHEEYMACMEGKTGNEARSQTSYKATEDYFISQYSLSVLRTIHCPVFKKILSIYAL